MKIKGGRTPDRNKLQQKWEKKRQLAIDNFVENRTSNSRTQTKSQTLSETRRLYGIPKK